MQIKYILTDDNPRFEKPENKKDIKKGIKKQKL